MECQGTISRECNLDAVAARNVLKVALAAKLAVEEELMSECSNPFLELHDMHDECWLGMHQIPTETSPTATKLGRVVECSQAGSECPIEEVTNMIDGKRHSTV